MVEAACQDPAEHIYNCAFLGWFGFGSLSQMVTSFLLSMTRLYRTAFKWPQEWAAKDTILGRCRFLVNVSRTYVNFNVDAKVIISCGL